MPIRWNPFDWWRNDDDGDDEDGDSDEEFDPLAEAAEIMEVIDDPDFDEWDQKGQIPKTNPPRGRDPDTGPLKKR